MKSVEIDSGLDEYIIKISEFEYLQTSIAVVNVKGELLYCNQAFDSFNKKARDSQQELYKSEKLVDCKETRHWLMSLSLSAQHNNYSSTFFYSKNITIDLTLLSTPVINRQNVLQGHLITIAEESIEHDRSHLARIQELNKSLKSRIIKLDKERIYNDNLIKILLRNSPFALIIFNDKQQVLQTNSKAEIMFNLRSGQMIGRHCSQLINCYQHKNECKALCSSLSIEAEEINLCLDAGNEATLLRSAEIVINDEQTLIVEAFIDATSIKNAEKEIRRLDEINTLLVESTGEGILSIDMDLNCTFINQSGARILDYMPDDISGKNISYFLAQEIDEKYSIKNFNQLIKKSLKNNTSMGSDATFKNRVGESVPVQFLCSPIHKNNKEAGAVIVFRNVTEARETEKKLDYLATHDSLTGLLNRYAFEIKLSHSLDEKCISISNDMLCFIDLDQFKIVNDTAGHNAGDELLRQIGQLINKRIRKSDVLSRLGGDEYGLLLSNCSLSHATVLVEKILQEIIDYRFAWEEKIFTVGASIGVVELNESFIDVSSAMKAADSSCYIAKRNGRHRLHIYDQNDKAIEQKNIESNWVNLIKDSIINNRFELWRQSIVPTNSKSSKMHFEILIRMLGENNQIISPGSFIPIAERYNLMTDIDKWVVRESIKYLSTTDLDKIDIISINVSGQSISDDQFIEFIENEFKSHRGIAQYICFEITETAAISNLSKASNFMEIIKGMGFSFALDDFGSGMSSFAYLKNLPVDYLKIDGNFIRDIENDRIDLAMVEAIHSVGKVMGIKTVAEFVETNGIIEILKKIGIDYIQGYAIDKPKPLI